MLFNRQTSLRLHEEHLATSQLWGRLERLIVTHAPEAELLEALRQGAAALDDEIARHFHFEEYELFPRLDQAGESDLTELLTEEHGKIRTAAQSLHELLRLGQPDAAALQQMRMLGLELAERLVAHVQKEETALLPALEDLLDEETDNELVLSYAAS